MHAYTLIIVSKTSEWPDVTWKKQMKHFSCNSLAKRKPEFKFSTLHPNNCLLLVCNLWFLAYLNHLWDESESVPALMLFHESVPKNVFGFIEQKKKHCHVEGMRDILLNLSQNFTTDWNVTYFKEPKITQKIKCNKIHHPIIYMLI